MDTDLPNYQGQNGIDGIYTRQRPDGTTEYIVVETKATQSGTAGDLSTMSDGTTQQMSPDWVDARIDSSGLTPAQAADLRQQIGDGDVTFVKADVTGVNPDAPDSPSNGTVTFTELTPDPDIRKSGQINIGDSWNPRD